eukprot:CAMPEP_0177658178 /NCGR_PEP_ID=MMETSP0447-20121125/16657_1 /TAXON_ID=0 /ORGANISM="Stygamoeba regulata, Strain BSH-02190019" /LENGTH=157 /DNA_ID=CAMNT_0019162737 /DNA_START=92 /DNA_END=565 /DNA_ORIENTATION=-
MDVLSQDQVAEFKECFNFFDPEKKGAIDKQNLKNILRQIGLKPTDAEVDSMVKEATGGGRDSIKFPEFLNMFADKLKKVDREDEIYRAFECFDTSGTGEIDFNVLRDILCEGDKKTALSDKEFREMCKDRETSEGKVEYPKIVKDISETMKMPAATQ